MALFTTTPAGLRLLSLDGGGVRGLSSLYILRDLMFRVAGDGTIAKPCEHFDMIGGTSTGGLIAIMLGRLEMTVDECIAAYKDLSETVFKDRRFMDTARKFAGLARHADVGAKYDQAGLEKAIVNILDEAKCPQDELLKKLDAKCKVFVCCLDNTTSQAVCLKSYMTPAYDKHLDKVSIKQACLATTAAISYFLGVETEPSEGRLSDGGLRENNPVWKVWEQAMAAWPEISNEVKLDAALRCLISIGTGQTGYPHDDDTAFGAYKRIKGITLDTEDRHQRFASTKDDLFSSKRYSRFEVHQSPKGVKLDEVTQLNVIVQTAESFLRTAEAKYGLRVCADILAGRQDGVPTLQSKRQFHVPFTLLGAPARNKFVDRPHFAKAMDEALLPSASLDPSSNAGCRVFVLGGMGGIGKTQLAINFASRNKASFDSVFWLRGNSKGDLRQSFCDNIKRIPKFSRYRSQDLSGESAQQAAIDDMLDWLRDDENQNWLLVFDNVDLDHTQEKDLEKGAYDIGKYLPGSDHGSVLVTSRLQRMLQLGDSAHMGIVDIETSREIFQKWNGNEIQLDKSTEMLLGPTMLSGLPLAIAQAAVYIKETGIEIPDYIRMYNDAKLWPQIVGASGNDRPLQGYDSAVGVTWSLSLEQCAQSEPFGPIAVNLVRLWAFLNNNNLWYGLFSDMVNLPPTWFGSSAEPDSEDLCGMKEEEWIAKWDFPRLPSWLADLQSSEATFLAAIKLLLAYNLIQPQAAEETYTSSDAVRVQKGYSMHPVVHTWAQRILRPGQREQFAKEAIGVFFTRRRTWEDWNLRHRFITHAYHAIRNYIQYSPADSKQDNPPRDSLRTICAMVRLGALYHIDGKGTEAIVVLRRAMSAKKMPWKVRSQVAYLMSSVLRDLRHYDEAEKICQERIRHCAANASEYHSERLSAELQLGKIHARQDKVPEAQAAWKKIVEAFDMASDSASLARRCAFRAMRHLAVSYAEEGKVSDANAWFNRAEEACKDVGDQKSEVRNRAILNVQIGDLHLNEGKYALAQRHYLEAQEAMEKKYGPGRLNTESLKLWLARTCIGLGQYKEAAGYLDEFSRSLSNFTWRLGEIYFELGYAVLDGDEDYILGAEASRLVRKTLKEVMVHLDPGSKESMYLYEKLKHIYDLQGRREEIGELERQWEQGFLEEEEQLGP